MCCSLPLATSLHECLYVWLSDQGGPLAVSAQRVISQIISRVLNLITTCEDVESVVSLIIFAGIARVDTLRVSRTDKQVYQRARGVHTGTGEYHSES